MAPENAHHAAPLRMAWTRAVRPGATCYLPPASPCATRARSHRVPGCRCDTGEGGRAVRENLHIAWRRAQGPRLQRGAANPPDTLPDEELRVGGASELDDAGVGVVQPAYPGPCGATRASCQGVGRAMPTAPARTHLPDHSARQLSVFQMRTSPLESLLRVTESLAAQLISEQASLATAKPSRQQHNHAHPVAM
jgi:hypothetical protein